MDRDISDSKTGCRIRCGGQASSRYHFLYALFFPMSGAIEYEFYKFDMIVIYTL